MASPERTGTLAPTWTFCLFDCSGETLPGEESDVRRVSRHLGVEREMKVMYQQPHLVPPMKLTVYDNIPATPPPSTPSHLSQWMSQGRNLASRASQRASLSTRKRPASRPIISNPQPAGARRMLYRPLELSIYYPSNRLSDLPEFGSIDFTDDGAIQLPPRALVRAKSAELRRNPSQRTPQKSASMIEEPTFSHHRTSTATSVISTSRPASNYDALHSHPVSWIEGALPGLPPQCHHRQPDKMMSILSPMQEELSPAVFTPACTPACIAIGDTMLQFPQSDVRIRAETPESAAPAPQIIKSTISKTITQAPFKLLRVPTSSSARSTHAVPKTHNTSPSLSSSYSVSTTSSTKSGGLSHWLSHSRDPSSTTSISTTKSFAEHRRKRSEFYQVRLPKPQQQQPQTSPRTQPSISTRIPFQQRFLHQRKRTLSASTIGSAMTVDTDIMSPDGTDANDSMTTISTAQPTVQDLRSGGQRARSDTLRSFSKPIVVVEEEWNEAEDVAVPEVPLVYADLAMDAGYLKEIGGRLRSPGVGIAF